VCVCVCYNNSLQKIVYSDISRWISLTLFTLIRTKSCSSHIEGCICLYSDYLKLWTHMWGFIGVWRVFFIVRVLSRHFLHQKTSSELLRRQWKHWPLCCITAVHMQKHTQALNQWYEAVLLHCCISSENNFQSTQFCWSNILKTLGTCSC